MLPVFQRHHWQHDFGYLREYRIKKSLELLDHGQMTIGEVSEAVGFHSVSYFCQCFRKKMRMTPKQYQKKSEHCDGMIKSPYTGAFEWD